MSIAELTIQQANIEALEAIAINEGRVTAFPGPAATENCANDWLHGKGICYDEFADGLCLACEVHAIEARILAGDCFEVEVRA